MSGSSGYLASTGIMLIVFLPKLVGLEQQEMVSAERYGVHAKVHFFTRKKGKEVYFRFMLKTKQNKTKNPNQTTGKPL